MIEALIRFIAGVLWEFILYGTGRMALFALSLGRLRAEALQGETARFSWSGFGRDQAGGLVLSQTWVSLVGGGVWMAGLFALLVALGRT